MDLKIKFFANILSSYPEIIRLLKGENYEQNIRTGHGRVT